MVGVFYVVKFKLLKVCLFFYVVLEGFWGVNNVIFFIIENKICDWFFFVKDGKDGNGLNYNFFFF